MSETNATPGKSPRETTRSSDRRTIGVEALARVEGEGAFQLVVRDGQVERVELKIFEPPRYYEAFLRGRDFREVPDIVARICGICPVAYQMSACHALERALGELDNIDPPIQALRNLFYCGEWIESHTLHMFMLHLPDFLGYESVISMAADHRELVQRSLRIKRVGNRLIELLGGRAVHPVGARVGGFHDAPAEAEVAEVAPELRACRDDMCDVLLTLAGMIEFPRLERDYEFVSLCADDEYPMNRGRIRSNRGMDVEQMEFGDAIEEYQVPHSTALHARVRGRGPYLVGPLARLNLNAAKLHPRAAELLPRVCEAVGAPLPWQSNSLSLLARGLEVLHALSLAADLVEAYRVPPRSFVPMEPREGIGSHGTEAPRGLCWHTYRLDADGTVREARIVPPTSQNQSSMEADLLHVAPEILQMGDEEATMRCERVLRDYDPCISCSVHFLRIKRDIEPKMPPGRSRLPRAD